MMCGDKEKSCKLEKMGIVSCVLWWPIYCNHLLYNTPYCVLSECKLKLWSPRVCSTSQKFALLNWSWCWSSFTANELPSFSLLYCFVVFLSISSELFCFIFHRLGVYIGRLYGIRASVRYPHVHAILSVSLPAVPYLPLSLSTPSQPRPLQWNDC